MDNLPRSYNAGLGDVIGALLTLRGTTTKWIAGKGWHDTDGLPVPNVMLLINTDTLLRNWYPEFRGIRAKPLPDVDKLNAAIPKAEWRVGLNKLPEPPWKLYYEFRLVDLDKKKLYVFANATYGTYLCYESIREAILVQRMLRGVNIIPLVSLEDRPMPTDPNPNGRRPHMEATNDWRELPDGGDSAAITSSAPAELPAPTPADTSQTAAESAPPAPTAVNALKPAAPPIPIEQFLDDEVPY
jgi:hypothetical protein